jgi:hypothetical protein
MIATLTKGYMKKGVREVLLQKRCNTRVLPQESNTMYFRGIYTKRFIFFLIIILHLFNPAYRLEALEQKAKKADLSADD